MKKFVLLVFFFTAFCRSGYCQDEKTLISEMLTAIQCDYENCFREFKTDTEVQGVKNIPAKSCLAISDSCVVRSWLYETDDGSREVCWFKAYYYSGTDSSIAFRIFGALKNYVNFHYSEDPHFVHKENETEFVGDKTYSYMAFSNDPNFFCLSVPIEIMVSADTYQFNGKEVRYYELVLAVGEDFSTQISK